MERTYFFAGQRVSQEDMNNITETLGYEIKHRTVDFFSKGVVGAINSVFVLNDTNNSIRIEPFIAYNNNGERINMYKEIRALGLDLTNPDEHRLRQQGTLDALDFGWKRDINYDIYVCYIEKAGRPQAQYSTGKFYPTRIYTGFEFWAIDASTTDQELLNKVNSMVRLCRLNYDGINLHINSSGYLDFSSVDATKVYTKTGMNKTTVYDPTTAVSMAQHIMCIGSGTPTASNPHGYTPEDLGFDTQSVQTHEKRMHTAGLSGDRSSVTSGLYIGLNGITTAQDNLILYNLNANEKLHSNGSWLSTIPIIKEAFAFIHFHDGNAPYFNPLPAGTYRFGIRPEDGQLFCGTNNAAISNANRYVTIASDSAGLFELARIQVQFISAYNAANVFDIAEFQFDPTTSPQKPISYIVNEIPRSNFIKKIDLRKFGSVDSAEFSTSKDGSENILTLPYTVQVDKLKLANGTTVGESAQMPIGYINGLLLTYNTTNTVTITAGRARDVSDRRDIVLNQNLTKQIDAPWVPGGTSIPVGGLMNNATSPRIPAGGGIPLHAFVIMTDAGDVDVAFDTDINAVNIRNSSATTAEYKYYRRIGSLYISHEYDSGKALHPFTTISSGRGTYTVYDQRLELTSNMYDFDNKRFKLTYVPGHSNLLGKFSFLSKTVENAIYTDLSRSAIPIYGGGMFEIYMNNQTMYTQSTWNFANNLYCVGYFDGRN